MISVISSILVIQRNEVTKNLGSIHVYVFEILRFALDDKYIYPFKQEPEAHEAP